MPGVITWGGLGDGEALGVAGFFAAGRRGFGRGFFLGAVFRFAFAAGIFFMSCPSCCDSPLTFTANTRANTPKTLSPLLQQNQFMISPF